ncbi:sulfatase-like hydrolase/transferase [Tunicatimonas pelagia]|uniref:sulfatase-like hydrolase/transferase n=1 Tax=Tunicatimonas pelagia TaxID=931531 RepID=UPI002666467A|nr:sulfatase-like hydrolase/transferase [Tunicatimonas pelagia]WKN42410.1 sulfatase-like hydrolase/transferase [Tunicatimonas pelagia]
MLRLTFQPFADTVNRSSFTVLAIALLFLGISCSSPEPTTTERPPNILWITSEDNSPFIGAYGDTFATTPNIDRLATEGVRYTQAFSAAPVCAPSRNALITGMYPNSLGTQHMRSTYAIPDFVRFYPAYLKEAGYYCTNNVKKDYNTTDQPEVWDESSREATYQNRSPGQPFFAIFNFTTSHESSVHSFIPNDSLLHDPKTVPIPPYHPRTPEMEHDWAQYYDRVQQMDAKVGEVLQALEESGLADSTIVFYYSDHGGVIGRSKRFIYESGLHIPLIIRFPKAYQHLASGEPGSISDRLVSFVDFAPTLLSLVGVTVPDYMQGNAFLGEQSTEPQPYVYNFRGRMDERFDMVRSVRDKQFRYVRNYMPHKIYAQYIEYLWRAPSMRSWEEAYLAGQLNEVQSAFFEEKPAEELYDVVADPHNINNLADDPEHQEKLTELKNANRQWLLDVRDVGFLPEAMMLNITEDSSTTLYEFTHSDAYPLEDIIAVAEMATQRDPQYVSDLISQLESENPIIRYWAATGCRILAQHATDAQPQLQKLLEDSEVSVQIAAAEALYHLGEKQAAVNALGNALADDNMMARVQALNVLETIDEDALPSLKTVQQLIPQDESSRDYDVRAAQRLAEKLAEMRNTR